MSQVDFRWIHFHDWNTIFLVSIIPWKPITFLQALYPWNFVYLLLSSFWFNTFYTPSFNKKSYSKSLSPILIPGYLKLNSLGKVIYFKFYLNEGWLHKKTSKIKLDKLITIFWSMPICKNMRFLHMPSKFYFLVR